MSGIQSICHPFATVIFKIITEQRKGSEHAEQSADHSQFFFIYDVFACVIFSKRSTERSAIFSVSCT